MFEYVCEVCGKTKRVHARRDIGRFCSRQCYAIGRMKKSIPNKDTDESNAKREPRKKSGCVFHPESIECSVRKCENCGWNPVVAEARLKAYGERKDNG